MLLDETHTCFVRDGKTFCKKDYARYVLLQLPFSFSLCVNSEIILTEAR